MLAVPRTVSPTARLEWPATATASNAPAAGLVLVLDRRHRCRDQIAWIASGDHPPARHIERIERERAGDVVLDPALIAAKPAAVVTARPAIGKRLAAAETARVRLGNGAGGALLAIA